MKTTTLDRPRQRKPLEPVRGTVKLLRPIGAVNPAAGEVLVNGKAYYLTRHATGFRLTGYDVRKQETTVYDLPLDLSSCDCPDATFREDRPEGGCKHRKALQALRNARQL